MTEAAPSDKGFCLEALLFAIDFNVCFYDNTKKNKRGEHVCSAPAAWPGGRQGVFATPIPAAWLHLPLRLAGLDEPCPLATQLRGGDCRGSSAARGGLRASSP